MLKITSAGLQAMQKQALAEYPAECCGILTFGSEGGAVQVHPCVNIQDQMHKKDPSSYPRQAKTAYFIDPQEFLKIVKEAEGAGGGIAGFYHSHIDCPAYFSDEDKERAMIWGEPAYPEAVYPVFSVCDGQLKEHKCFVWDEDTEEYVETALDVVD